MPVAAAQLERVWLKRVLFDADPAFEPSDAAKVTYFVDPTSRTSDLIRDEDGYLGALVILEAKVSFERTEQHEVDGDQPLPFELEIELAGHFEWAPHAAPDDRLASAWLGYNGTYLLWPYLRTYIATITGLSHVPPLTIYTMSVPKPPVVEPPDATSDDAAPASPTPHPESR